MKTASIQHIDTLVNTRINATYQIEFRKLSIINTYIMKKLTNVSPFLLLLVPVFMMMALTLTTSGNTGTENETALKSAATTVVAKIPAQQLK